MRELKETNVGLETEAKRSNHFHGPRSVLGAE